MGRGRNKLVVANNRVHPLPSSSSWQRPLLQLLPSSKVVLLVAFHVALLVSSLAACNPQSTARSSREYTALAKEEPSLAGGPLASEVQAWMNEPYQNMSNIPFNLHEVVTALNGTYDLESSPDRIFTAGHNSHCSACRLFAKFVIGYVRGGGPAAPLVKLIISICYLVFYRNQAVCSGIIKQEKDILQYILLHSTITGDQLCAMVMSGSSQPGGCGIFRGPRWTVALPPPSRAYATPPSREARHLSSGYSDKTNDRGFSTIPRELSLSQQQQQPTMNSSPSLSYPPGGAGSISTGPNYIDNDGNSKQRTSVVFFNNRRVSRNKPYTLFNSGFPYLKVLHLTDIHFDPNYREGSNAVCEAPLCCNRESGKPRRASDTAGRWGDYRHCDTPRLLIENMMRHIQQHHSDIDYIMWTGDSVPHDLWKISRRGNSKVISEVADMIHHHFPGVPVYGSIGNHASFPRDSFPPPEVPKVWNRFGVQWLYDTIVNQWQSFVPSSPIPSSARIAGCYTMPVGRGFKIISINTNYCYKFNWWTLFKSVDPGNVLRWLVGELLTAEANGEYVHIIGHVAPLYPDCYEEWGHQFSRIVTRFSHIIRGQFYGHCHRDEVRLHFDVREHRLPIGVEYLTPNNGPYRGLNPSFRLYYVDGDHEFSTRGVIDYETYFMNLTNANVYGDPRWQMLYRAKRDLGMAKLEPADWDKFVHRMARDRDLTDRWHRYNVQASDHELAKGCNELCRHKLICSIVEGDKFMPRKCRPPPG